MNAKFFCTILLLLTVPAFAECTGRTIIRSNVCVGTPVVCTPPAVVVHTPVAIATEIITPVLIPVAVPIVVPAFTYQYTPPVATAGPAYPVYPGSAPAYPPGPAYPQPGYGQPYQQPGYGQPYQQMPTHPQQAPIGNNGDSIRELARALLEEIRRQDAGGDSGPPMVQTPGFSSPPPVTNQSSKRANPTSRFAQSAINAMARNCMACHTGPGAKGGVQIFLQHNVLNPNAPFATMAEEIRSGRMPQVGSNFRATPQEREIMQAWLDGQ